ncbi:MAG: response regulator [Methylobacterium sp.]|nr:MAG: response regulator [Methylobacterium sp.]
MILPRPVRWRRLLRHLGPLAGADPAPLVDPAEPGFDADLARRLPLTILLAEDNVINQRVAGKMLERFGYRVRIVGDGRQAVELLGVESFDVVLMDVHMPVLDGLEATRELRRLGSRAYVVAMTASAFDSDREACLEAGMDDYLSKPLLVPDLVQTLRRASAARLRRGDAC